MIATARIVRIGNSRGIRVPKSLLDEAQLSEEVELHADQESLYRPSLTGFARRRG